jgi:hypothetical protein
MQNTKKWFGNRPFNKCGTTNIDDPVNKIAVERRRGQV